MSIDTQSVKQGTEAWLKIRAGRITGSRVGAILGCNPFSTRNDVMREMVREHYGASRDFTGNIATRWGSDHEDAAIAQYEEESGNFVTSTGFWEYTGSRSIGASPDGLVGSDGVIEVKCPYSQNIKPLGEQPHYYAQIQLVLHCTDREWCDFVSWTPTRISIERVEIDDNWMIENFKAIDDFYGEFLAYCEDKESAKGFLEDLIDERTDEEWELAAEQFLTTKGMVDELLKQLDRQKKVLVQLANDKKSAGYGVTVYPIARKGSIDYASLAAENNIDVEAFRKEGSVSWAVKGS